MLLGFDVEQSDTDAVFDSLDDDRSGKEAVEGFGRELACEDKQAFSVADLRAPIGDVVRERFGVDVSEQASRSDSEEGAHVVCAAGLRDPVGEV